MATAELLRNDYPAYAGELFSPEALRNPFPHYRAIRDKGPAVYLEHLDLLAIGRFQDVQTALRTPEILISGEGIGFNPIANRQTPERGVLTSDGERHRRLRSTLQRPLMPAALKERRDMLKSLMTAQVDSLVGKGTFDAVPALARHLPLKAVTVLVGLDEEARSKMLQWAAAFFNTLRPMQEGEELPPEIAADMELLMEARDFFAHVDPSTLAPGSWSANLFEAVGQGRLSELEGRGALRAFVIPSLDTTIYAKANLLYNLATNPDQWALLRQQPSLIPSAVLEGVRHSAVVRAFSRFAVEDYRAGEVFIPKGQRVMVIFGSANRDERQYPDPDRFDVTRNPVDQLGWGTGPHMCVGMHLAKLEMEILLEVLVERVERLEAGEPVVGLNAGLYGLDALPFRLN